MIARMWCRVCGVYHEEYVACGGTPTDRDDKLRKAGYFPVVLNRAVPTNEIWIHTPHGQWVLRLERDNE